MHELPQYMEKFINVSAKDILKNKIPVIQPKPSVFFLINQKEIVFIGLSLDVMVRIANLRKENKMIFDHYAILECPSEYAPAVQCELIVKYEPKYNKTLPHNQGYITRGKIKEVFNINGHRVRHLIKKYQPKQVLGVFYNKNQIQELLKCEGLI